MTLLNQTQETPQDQPTSLTEWFANPWKEENKENSLFILVILGIFIFFPSLFMQKYIAIFFALSALIALVGSGFSTGRLLLFFILAMLPPIYMNYLFPSLESGDIDLAHALMTTTIDWYHKGFFFSFVILVSIPFFHGWEKRSSLLFFIMLLGTKYLICSMLQWHPIRTV